MKNDPLVWIQHVQARPQIEPIHPFARNRAIVAESIGVGIGKWTLSSTSDRGGRTFPGGIIGRQSPGCHSSRSSLRACLPSMGYWFVLVPRKDDRTRHLECCVVLYSRMKLVYSALADTKEDRCPGGTVQ